MIVQSDMSSLPRNGQHRASTFSVIRNHLVLRSPDDAEMDELLDFLKREPLNLSLKVYLRGRIYHKEVRCRQLDMRALMNKLASNRAYSLRAHRYRITVCMDKRTHCEIHARGCVRITSSNSDAADRALQDIMNDLSTTQYHGPDPRPKLKPRPVDTPHRILHARTIVDAIVSGESTADKILHITSVVSVGKLVSPPNREWLLRYVPFASRKKTFPHSVHVPLPNDGFKPTATAIVFDKTVVLLTRSAAETTALTEYINTLLPHAGVPQPLQDIRVTNEHFFGYLGMKVDIDMFARLFEHKDQIQVPPIDNVIRISVSDQKSLSIWKQGQIVIPRGSAWTLEGAETYVRSLLPLLIRCEIKDTDLSASMQRLSIDDGDDIDAILKQLYID